MWLHINNFIRRTQPSSRKCKYVEKMGILLEEHYTISPAVASRKCKHVHGQRGILYRRIYNYPCPSVGNANMFKDGDYYPCPSVGNTIMFKDGDYIRRRYKYPCPAVGNANMFKDGYYIRRIYNYACPAVGNANMFKDGY